MTPLQVALAYAAIANGGWLPAPFLVKSADTEDGSYPTDRFVPGARPR